MHSAAIRLRMMNLSWPMGFFGALVCLLLTVSTLRGQSFGNPALGQSPDKAWIESLIDLSAAELAAEVCQFRLDRTVPDSNAHAQWRMLLLHAKSAELLEKLDWNSPIDLLQKGLKELSKAAAIAPESESSRRDPWVRWKELWCRRLINQHTLAAYLAVPGRKIHQDWLLQSIRIGLDELDRLEQVVLKMQPDKPIVSKTQRELKDKTLPNEITAGEILDLRGEIELLRADLLYQRSQCYPDGSDEQIAAATQMLTSIDRASGQLAATWTNLPLLLLAKAEAELQLGRHSTVQKNMTELWESLGKSSFPESKSWRLTAASLAIRSARMTQQWQTADSWFARCGGWKDSPELALEHLAILVERELDRSASPESILGIRKQISERFGRYWEQRVDAMLVSNPAMKNSISNGVAKPQPDSGQTMASLELFRIQARQALAANDIDKAIEKLQQAELAASKLGSNQEAFNIAMQIAAVLERSGQQNLAADEFYRAAISYPEASKASQAAMMSAWLIRNADPKLDDEARQVRRSTYMQRLKETATLWPQSPSAEQAIELLEANWFPAGDYVACLEFWKEYLSKSPQAESRAIRRWLIAALVTQEDWLEKPLGDQLSMTRASSQLQEALIQTAKLREKEGASDKLSSETLSAWIQSVSPDRRWSLDIQMEIPESQESDSVGKLADAWNRCETAWQTGSLNRAMLDELEQIAKACKERFGGSATLGGGRLERFLVLLRAEVDSKDSQELKTRLEKLIAQEPKSLWWVYRSSRVMQRTMGLGQAALGWYRQMANGVKPGSEPWLEARARSIELLKGLGDNEKANQLRDLVLASYPDLPAVWNSRLTR